MNHLHHFLEAFEVGLISQGPAVFELAFRKCLRGLGEIARSAICFDMGDAHVLDAMPANDSNLFPYEVCWFEVTLSDHGLWGVLAAPNAVGGMQTAIFRRGATTDSLALAAHRRIQTQEHWTLRGIRFGAEGTDLASPTDTTDIFEGDDEALVVDGLLSRFLGALHSPHAALAEVHPDAPLQKARARRGKAPLFSYWTLILRTPPSSTTDSLGGTHASPRTHLRRGHLRRLRSGKVVQVKPTTVRGETPGIVLKDYRAEFGGGFDGGSSASGLS